MNDFELEGYLMLQRENAALKAKQDKLVELVKFIAEKAFHESVDSWSDFEHYQVLPEIRSVIEELEQDD